MSIKKLTLSANENTIKEAKRIATQKDTSVSALFARLIHTIDQAPTNTISLAPITLQASGIISLSTDLTDQELLENALNDKYGLSS